MYNFIRSLNEGTHRKELVQTALPYARDALGRSLSKISLDYHYGQLYKGYVDRFNSGDGDADFNEAGAFLHDIYFTQFHAPRGSNAPHGKSQDFIQEHFQSFEKFKEKFQEQALKIQGSGWCYVGSKGQIKTIQNHQIKQDIVILIDFWEHAFNLDFRADKKKYLNTQWKIINWDVINQRL